GGLTASTFAPENLMNVTKDAAQGIIAGLNAGLSRMEVEFPLTTEINGFKDSADQFLDANIQLAIAAGRVIHKETGKKVHLLLPDGTEYRRAMGLYGTGLSLGSGVTLGHLRESRPGKFGTWFRAQANSADPDVDAAAAGRGAEVFFALNASAVELPDIERYATDSLDASKPLITWNLALDTLRADLGLLGFPSKALHDRFLSFFKPVLYVRPRDYSKSTASPPYISNYSGILFREFPGEWKVMLQQPNGSYTVVEGRPTRYTLGEFKDVLMRAAGLDTDAQGSLLSFLRKGYKTKTWWEEREDKELSPAWRE
ncbi:hypothetical protein APUTEX25_004059, partial [Auxenochlorella protothecoides]